jgi:prepilin signal peptidase PulO-like enzyme (type II secretory pathway)
MINAKNLGLAGGILWTVVIFLTTLISMWTGWASEFLNLMSGVYPGFNVSYLGAVIGAVWGFLDGFIGFWLLAWLYNKLEEKNS